MNGEFVAWDDAKVHVLTHGLHYGTGVFEGIRCYDTELGPAIFRHHDHLDRLLSRPSSTTCRCPYTLEEIREATHELIAPQRAAHLLHPPARLPRLRRDGPVPARRAGRRGRSPSGRGAPTSARRASSNGIRAKVSLLAADLPASR